MLSHAEESVARQVLSSSAMREHWPDLDPNYLNNVTARTYSPGDIIHQPGDAPAFLFVVLEGEVLHSATHRGVTWFEQRLRPGEFFGQHALFRLEYRSTASVPRRGTGALVLCIAASDVRVALERNASLRENLLREKLAGRLRRIPLLRELEDDEIYWIAQAVEAQTFAAGAKIPVDKKAGIWLVDRGQVAVTGPANPHPDLWEEWRLAAGHFFVAMGSADSSSEERDLEPLVEMRYGINCAADAAIAHLPAQLYYLPADHANRLVEGTPDVAALLSTPPDIAAHLEELALFKELGRRQVTHLAQFVGWEFVPRGLNVTTQGNTGHSLVALRDGAAAVVAYDDQGRERPRSKLLPGSYYGATALRGDQPRDASVRAVKSETVLGADVLILDRRDLRHASRELPDLWAGNPLIARATEAKTAESALSWLREGEELLWLDRPHWWWLVGPLAVLILALGVLVGLLLLTPPVLREGVGVTVALLIGLVILPGIFLVIYNYRDDYYAVTNRRATRRDRQFFFYQSLQEAPVEAVQDVTTNNGFWGRIFDFGDVTLRTAFKGAAITFNNVRHPEAVKQFVETGRTQAKAAERGRHKEAMRRGLISELHLQLPIPERGRPIGEVDAPAPSTPMGNWLRGLIRRRNPRPIRIPTRASTRPILERLTRSLSEETRSRVLGPEKKAAQTAGELIWRKHPLNMIGRTWAPFFLTLFSLIALILVIASQLTIAGLTTVQFVLMFGLLLIVGAGWLWWQYTDYANDLYVVTDDRIIDIEMMPLGLKEKRREAGLDRVQNVTAEQKGVWAAIFRYGDVVISTAAADEGFTFNMVPNPKTVQATIFQKLDAYRARQEEKRSNERRNELIDGLEVYHNLR